MKTLALIISLFITQAAWATGGTYCQLKTSDIDLRISLVNGRVPGNPVVPGSGVEIKTKTNNIIMDEKDLVGWWSMGNELKMHFVKFQTGNDTRDTQLIVEATYSDVHETYLGMVSYEGPQGRKVQEIISCELK
ncbi:MAG: hypothetical protein HRT44_11100 [Bdellovibrionales bacterium]|nr:hypothetical protein [Bdellovibrionales bacterium]NQZ19787.1 hypothetical protein [Bdellovibrionales bacterium]